MSDIVIPSFGESISEARISQWLVQNNEKVKIDQLVAVVDSDKVSYDLIAEKEGYIQIIAAEGESVAIGQIVAHVFSQTGKNNIEPKNPDATSIPQNPNSTGLDNSSLKDNAPLKEARSITIHKKERTSLKQIRFTDLNINDTFIIGNDIKSMHWCSKIGGNHYIYIGESGFYHPNEVDEFFIQSAIDDKSESIIDITAQTIKHSDTNKRMDVDEKRPLLTKSVMDALISMRLRDNEVPHHVDALTAARDFYEMRISRDYVFRPKARAEVVRLLDVIRELRQCAGPLCSGALEQKVADILSHEDQLFVRMNEKGK